MNRFWETKALTELDDAEWESLCDGCGKCCLEKVVYKDDGQLVFTNVACKLLNRRTGRCSRYADRQSVVPDCWKLTPENLQDCFWLPKTCAYRLLAEGKPLPEWHPLVSGDPRSVKRAGMSVAGRVRAPVPAEELQKHLVYWEDL